MAGMVECEARGNLAILRIKAPPVNALGQAVRDALCAAHEECEADDGINAILVTGDGRFFSAGADITEFGGKRRPPYLTDVIARFEAGEKPIIALINGIAYGGGLELALGCDYRLGLSETKLALPEINLGLLPGAGGTQKLPRLIGAAAALEFMLSGKPVTGSRALELGLIDDSFDSLDAALARAEEMAAKPLKRRRIIDMEAPEDMADLDQVAAPYRRRLRGSPAVEKILEGVRMSETAPIKDGLEWEIETFRALKYSPESKAQRHLFFAEREAYKIADVPADTAKRGIEMAGVVGAGTMGAGIAMCLIEAGIKVILTDQEEAGRARGLERIRQTYEAACMKGRLAEAEMAARLARLSLADDIAALAPCDLVIEAVFEAMEVKRQVFSALDQVCKPGAILATNTSTLDVNEIARATGRPEDVIGLHFFSPAHIMRLLEIVRADETAPEVIATAMDLARRIRKQPVLVGVCNGFAGNRMFINFNREAQILIEQGALPWEIDKVLTDFGLAMGPLSVMDLAGLDVGYRIRKERGPQTPYPFTSADRLAEAGRFGQKTGKGWYLYPDGARKGVPDPEVVQLVEEVAREKGITRRSFSSDEILHRSLWQLVNTGCQILEEGIAQRASDLDVIFAHGYGFPVVRGGPMHYAEEVGLARVLDDIRRYADEVGDHWVPSAYLVERAEAGGAL